MHVFVVGRQRLAAVAAVRSILHDWSAVGLVGPSVWIDVGTETSGAPGDVALTGLLIDQGVASPIDLRWWIPRNPGPIRLVALQVLTDPTASMTSQEVRQLVEALRLPPRTPLVNLLVPVDRLTGVSDAALFDSQVNVLVQPVDGAGPQAATEPLVERSPTFSMHAAAATATAGGLWIGMQRAPLDDERPWSGLGVAVARSYFRRLDGAPILDRLAQEVFGADGTLPMTHSRTREPLGVVAPAAQLPAAEAAGYAVLAKHGDLTRFRPPPPFQPPAATKLGFGQAFRMYFTFVGRAIANAPQAWAQELMDRARTGIENRTNAFLFGDNSQYAVVLSGLQDDRTEGTDQAAALQYAAIAILGRLAPGSEPSSTPAPRLWDDTVRTAAALVDGGAPDPSIPLPTRDAGRLVINNPSRIAPRPGTPPFRLPPGSPGAQFGPIAANDPYHAMQVDRALEAASRTAPAPGQAGPAHAARLASVQQTRHQLAGWVEGNRGTLGAMSTGLAGELDKARSMQAELLQPAPELTEEEKQAPLRAQRQARKMVFVWLLVLIVLVALPAVLAGIDVIGWAVAAAVMVAAVLFSLLGAVISFQRGQRALMHAIYRLRYASAYRAWLAEHAVTVTQEVVRLAGLYRQSRAWSDVIAEYVHAPFGRLPEAERDGAVPTTLTGDLPLAVTLASAQFSPRAHEPVVYQARAQMLQADWLFTAIDIRRQLVIEEVKQRTGRDLESRVNLDTTLQAGGPLMSYLAALRDPEVQARARRFALSGLVRAVDDAGVRDRLLPTVRVDAGAMHRDESWDALTADLFTPPSQLAYEGFSNTGVTNQSPTVGRSFLAADVAADPRSGFVALPVAPGVDRHQLDRLVVRWDLSHPVTIEELTYFSAAPDEPQADDGPVSMIDVDA